MTSSKYDLIEFANKVLPKEYADIFNTFSARTDDNNMDDALEFGRTATFFLGGTELKTQDHIKSKKLLFKYYHDMAKRGSSVAMRDVATRYARGHHRLKAKKGELVIKPDFKKAKKWLKKAEEKNDLACKGTRHFIERQIKKYG